MTTREYIEQNRLQDVRRLALTSHPQGVDMQYALTQISGWQAARVKVPSWAACPDVEYPVHLSLEQCTSQYVAEYKSEYLNKLLGTGFTMADLTGGMGVDCFFISANASHAVFCEIQPGLCELARHNYSVLGRSNIEVHNQDSQQFISGLPADLDLIYIDPARRGDAGRKLVSISECMPDVTVLQDDFLRLAHHVMVKLSPMLDISRALTELRNVSRILVIGLEGECKEITFVMERGYTGEPVIEAVDINSNGKPGVSVQATKSQDQALPLPIAEPTCLVPGAFICEPSAPYMKSALFRTIAAQTGTQLLHPETHLFQANDCPEYFPGRVFRLKGIIPFEKRELAALVKTQANLSVRNFPESAPQLQKRLKLRDGGQRYLIATTLQDSRRVILDLVKE